MPVRTGIWNGSVPAFLTAQCRDNLPGSGSSVDLLWFAGKALHQPTTKPNRLLCFWLLLILEALVDILSFKILTIAKWTVLSLWLNCPRNLIGYSFYVAGVTIIIRWITQAPRSHIAVEN